MRTRPAPVRIALIMLLIASSAAPSGTAAAATQIPPQATEYVALLQGSLDALNLQPPDVVRARAPIASLTDGPLASNGFAPRQALQPILNDLDATPKNVVDAAVRLQTLIGALRPANNRPLVVDHGAARDTLKTVYASPAFAGLDSAPQPSWVARLGEAIRRFFDRFQPGPTNRAPSGHGAGMDTGTLVVIAALVLLIGGVVWWMLRDRLRQTGMVEPAGTTSDPDAEWAAALEAARVGDYREAIRRAFRSSLLGVARHGRLPVDPAWTTRELLARAQGDADLIASLAPAADAFQVAWYSRRSVGEADWNAARARCEGVRALAANTTAGVR